ncbi:MAG: 23S rRNA (guanosine(2251)-2'-O)-methyltransferase RlmB [Syntrophaceae bacterium]|nr:23S rRNA (guanosine(2251)-2'-O)-methyltransferase RlmB [Syntrophaceae bacterium]
MSDQIIYGINPVLEALRSDRQLLNKVLLAAGKEGGPIRLVRQLAREKGIPVQVSPKEALDRLGGSGHHQGVLGFTAASSYSTWENLLNRVRSEPGKSIVLVLDSIEDPQNLGSLIRTAEACGVKGVILPKDRAAGITPAVVKASAGAVVHLPIVRVTNLASTLEELKKEGFWIVGADSRAGKNLYELKFDMNVGLVIGSEGKGVRPLLLKKCDHTVSIPMRGKVSSLNAAIAGAVILFEILRQQLAQKV